MERARRILIVEDDPRIASTVDLYLRNAGYATLLARTGDEGLARARSEAPDLVVLDLMLPGRSGLEVCRALRRESSVPLIMLTARSAEDDRLRGLGAGADDYVTKPFSPRELVARVEAVLRRADASAARRDVLTAGDLVVDTGSREVKVGGRPVALTAAEFRILEKLVRAPGRVFTRDELLDGDEALDRTIDAHVKNLRRKIEEDRARPTRIVTVFGVGYRFVGGR